MKRIIIAISAMLFCSTLLLAQDGGADYSGRLLVVKHHAKRHHAHKHGKHKAPKHPKQA